ncbi:MAG: Glucose-6-phosphate 1-dehydrogenase [Candidatus Pacebacteria bacterium GW2011_GWB1_47_8]|nr:MAG: Glucose-6-phosphate 1-dehydrogenase [Candidatus Pacebacteria bacterium GW2011_GWA1_46_10]KKU84248.1 MAG: Glucose-6-phosphate 1-dehydrogenase [Candidatus Pacebacteria bacterium GW2011_GWB1_47_8]HCR81468.1 glucose-6-phosphate dehydrogenase [Candidatus Paceibacterota bacterium]
MKKRSPVILIIIGITGDLARRKLLPAIEQIAAAGELPKHFQVLGITRRQITAEAVLKEVINLKPGSYSYLKKHLSLYRMDLTKSKAYAKLKQDLYKLSKPFGQPSQQLFYLAIPPQVSPSVVEQLGKAGLAAQPGTKLLMEKPFGTDLTSARDLITRIQQYFNEDQIYRIDHYLAKEMAQNLLVFRSGNSLFKNTWNNQFIEKIEVINSEKIGVEGRAAFYEQTGALRDMVQSHLLQLAALVLMRLPAADDLSQIQSLRYEALAALRPPTAEEVKSRVSRAQYEGYGAAVGNQKSTVETFVSLTLYSDEYRWNGVPIVLTVGKALDQQVIEIRMSYKKQTAEEANQLTLRLQPYEGIEFDFWSKRPGYDRQLENVPLSFAYRDHFETLPEAYEKVLLDAIHSDHSLFPSSAEVLASWKILEPIQRVWAREKKPLKVYKPGSSIEEVMSL